MEKVVSWAAIPAALAALVTMLFNPLFAKDTTTEQIQKLVELTQTEIALQKSGPSGTPDMAVTQDAETILEKDDNRITMTTAAAPDDEPSARNDLLIASFENGYDSTNDLGYAMGVAYDGPDHMSVTFVTDPDRGRVAQIEYDIKRWAAFFLLLGVADSDEMGALRFSEQLDLTGYGRLAFDVRTENSNLGAIKIELRLNHNRDSETYLTYISGDEISAQWQTLEVGFEKFFKSDEKSRLITDLTKAEQLVFVVEQYKLGGKGTFYFDNIRFER